MIAPGCRFCGSESLRTFVDLGPSPLCNRQVLPERAHEPEPFYPLHAKLCERCFLVQLEELVSPQEIFGEYGYFSSYSSTWIEHSRAYAEMAVHRFELTGTSLVVEIASNDGYLLQHFVDRGIPVLGCEPARNIARVAIDKGIRTTTEFFGTACAERIAEEVGRADLLVANNVLAHVPALNDFVEGLRILLAPSGVATLEFPHLLRLIDGNQFDTIYHEHFSYFSFSTVEAVFSAHGLALFDVDELPTHGGSLRIYASHSGSRPETPRVRALRAAEQEWGVRSPAPYAAFEQRVHATKRQILDLLIRLKDEGRRIVGYGSPGKGNTLLNYCGIRTDFLDYTVDRNPYKQGTLTPGTRIPVVAPERIFETRPDYILVLPWNLEDEIASQLQAVRSWGCRFIVPIPTVRVR